MKFCPPNRRSGRFLINLVAALFALGTSALADTTGWQGQQTIPNVNAADGAIAVATSSGGATILAWYDNTALRTAYRPSRGASWTLETAGPDESNGLPALAMNAKGDAVIAWIHQDFQLGFVDVNYRPANGTWGTVVKFDNNNIFNSEETPTAAINSSGTAVVAWSNNGFTAPLKVVSKTAAGSWSASPETVTSTASNLDRRDPVVGIDDSGNEIVVYVEDYGQVQWTAPNNSINDVLDLFVLREQTKPAGGSWSPAADITPRTASAVNNGVVICDASFGGAPTINTLQGSVDPVTGKIGIGFSYQPNTHAFEPLNASSVTDLPGQCQNSTNFPDTIRAAFAWGTVSAGLGTLSTAGGGDPATLFVPTALASSQGGFGAIGWLESVSSIDNASIGVGQIPVNFGESSGLSESFAGFGDQHGFLGLAVGGEGTAFEILGEPNVTTSAVVRSPAGSVLGTTVVINGVFAFANVAADGCGNALVAGDINGQVAYNDYVSGKTGSQCASAGPTPTPTPRPTPTPTPNPLTLASNLVRATTSAVSTAEKKLAAAPSRRLPKSQQDKINAQRKTIATARTNLKSDESQLITLEKKSGPVIRKRVSGFTAKNLKTLQSDTNTAIGENEKRPSSAAKLWKTILALLKKL